MPHPLEDSTEPAVRTLIERCLVDRDEVAWTLFLDRYRDLIRRSCWSSDGGFSAPEFVDWFPGWLFETRKLHALYRALCAKIECGECSTPRAEENYVRNYLVDVVRSAVGDWFRQRRPPPSPRPRPDHEEPPEVKFEEQVAHLRAVLARLPGDLRIPFWLRHRQALGPLPRADLESIAQPRRSTVEDVEQAITREFLGQSRPDRPLSSRFIGTLLGLAPLSNGSYAAVDQRIRRACKMIQEFVGDEERPCSS